MLTREHTSGVACAERARRTQPRAPARAHVYGAAAAAAAAPVLLLLLCASLCADVVSATTSTVPQWSWMSGASTCNGAASYGTRGVASLSNVPGARVHPAAPALIDNAANLWLFGGHQSVSPAPAQLFNDLWRYNALTGKWTWVSGASTINQAGVYGDLGSTTSSATVPGARTSANMWLDNTGSLWLFGGFGLDGVGAQGVLNDLFSYNPIVDRWSWRSGSNSSNAQGVYGTQGVAAPGNVPSGRGLATSWMDTAGNLYVFGGYSQGGSQQEYNDLWKFSPSSGQWMWVSGSSTVGASGVYGSMGLPSASNTPGARSGAAGWVDGFDGLWLMGGIGITGVGTWGLENDLWRYDTLKNTWTWVAGYSDVISYGLYGTMGVESMYNLPGSRQQMMSWPSHRFGLWMLGGTGRDGFDTEGQMNDLWHFDMLRNTWTWLSGSNASFAAGTYGTQGASTMQTTPGARSGGVGWRGLNGESWVFGGYGDSGTGGGSGGLCMLNDMWHMVPPGPCPPGTHFSATSAGTSCAECSVGSYAETAGMTACTPCPAGTTTSIAGSWTSADCQTPGWVWWSGSMRENQPSTYGPPGYISNSYTPGARLYAVTWSSVQGDAYFVYGGCGLANGSSPTVQSSWGALADMWMYAAGDGWMYVGGPVGKGAPPVYDSRGTLSFIGWPGARCEAAHTADRFGNVFLYGGRSGQNAVDDAMSDLWMYSSTRSAWTYVGGAKGVGNKPSFGTKGVPALSNSPGGRVASVMWHDFEGDVWLFGGVCSIVSPDDYCNDMWKYTTSTGMWTWLSGASAPGQNGVYGTRGVESASSYPGSRIRAAAWIDWRTFKLALFGGYGLPQAYSVQLLNDHWEFNTQTNSWTWVNGDVYGDASGIYGVLGQPNSYNMPGARDSAARVVDSLGNLWIYGGYGHGQTVVGALDDLWCYANNTWTWMGGSTNLGGPSYGQQQYPSLSNTPGGRFATGAWHDPTTNNIWVFGGNSNNHAVVLLKNDMWSFQGGVAYEDRSMIGAIVGGAIGGTLAVVALIVIAAVLAYRHQQRQYVSCTRKRVQSHVCVPAQRRAVGDAASLVGGSSYGAAGGATTTGNSATFAGSEAYNTL